MARGRLCNDSAMSRIRIAGQRVELTPLPAAAADALPGDRPTASRLIGASLPNAWPQPDLLDVLPMQAAATSEDEQFGIWLMIERDTDIVVGDIGFMGPPDDGSVEIGFSVIPDRRRRGYASEAVVRLVAWALEQPEISEVVARSDADNEASARTLSAAGFIRVDEHDGTIRWRRDRASASENAAR
jgi:[ribosomal protein S5]-alanine N-acetyltransferase